MAPKSGEKKPAKKVVKKTGASAGDKKKKVSRKAVESYKIYIYKVGFCAMQQQQHVVCCVLPAVYAHVSYKLSRSADSLPSPCRCSSRSTLTQASAPRP